MPPEARGRPSNLDPDARRQSPRARRGAELQRRRAHAALACAICRPPTGRPASSSSSASTTPRATAASRRSRAELPDVEIRQVGRNDGFPANNHALRDLDGVRYVALVNNDAFVEPGWLEPLVEALDADLGLGAACPKLILAPRFTEVVVEAPRVRPRSGRPPPPRRHGPRGRRSPAPTSGATPTPARAATAARPTAPAPSSGSARDGGAARAGPRRRDRPVGEVAATLVLQAARPVTRHRRRGAGPQIVAVGTDPTPVTVALAGERFDVLNNVGSQVFVDGAGADRGWLERDDGRYDEPVERVRLVRWGRAVAPRVPRRRRPLRRALLPLLRGHRPLVAGPGPGLALPHRAHQPVVRHLHAASSRRGLGGLRLPRRAQPAPHAGEERAGPPGRSPRSSATSW